MTTLKESVYPILPLRDVVIYPYMVIPLFVGREKSIKALERAMNGNQKIFLVAQKAAQDEEPKPSNLFKVGTIATILQLLRLPDGTLKVLVEGNDRGKIKKFVDGEPFMCAEVDVLSEKSEDDVKDAVVRSLLSQFDHYVKLNKKIPPEVFSSLAGVQDVARMADTIAAHMTLKIEDRQKLLEEKSLAKRVDLLMKMLEQEIELLQVEKKIRSRVKGQMEKNQREYYLTEQLKAIRKELGDSHEGYNEVDSLEKKIKSAGMTREAMDAAMKELAKLKSMSPMSAEATVSRNYIDSLIAVPWRKKSKLSSSLADAQKVLDKDHYGLDKVKERIIEYLAVQQRVKKLKGPILCLVGPPGVGKTSLGASIARATNREFTRMALGGLRDEAEIRGHRRTYIGALPGKIIQKLSKVKVKNPLFLLDEIDKMSTDFRGDPSSALLEVLDPEQNNAFNDHFLEVDVDLSEIMFVATSNSYNIPEALLDRMEVIQLSGYTEDEKLNIAKKYLVSKHMKSSGLKKKELQVKDEGILSIIRYYTREAGVRGLEREIAKICRKVVRNILLDKNIESVVVDDSNIDDYLGVKRYRFGLADEDNQVGQVNGLAWTEVGGELLKVEAVAVPGKGKTLRTGKLGDVMLESIQAAITVVRSRAESLGIDSNFYEKQDIHVHVPEGATPKDGPSAGIAMCTALVSVLTGIPVRSDVAMTGEITLRGEVLPIGGLKEKLLAAHRAGITTVLIPDENQKDLVDIPTRVKKALEIKPVRWIDEVLETALSESISVKQLSAKAKSGSSNKPNQPQMRTH